MNALVLPLMLSTLLAEEKKVAAPFDLCVPNFKTYTFEAADDLKEFKAGETGSISLETGVYKNGHSSMRWSWNDSAESLVFKNKNAFKNLTGENPDPIVYDWITETSLSSFSLWIYNKTPIKDALWFEIGDGKKVDTRFWMSLDFSGWRQFNAMYGRDMVGFPNQKSADTLRIIPPKSISKGTLIFDDFSPRRELDVRFVKGSEVVPWVHRKDFRVDQVSPIEYFAKFDAYNEAVTPEKVKISVPTSLTDQQQSEIKRLQKEYLARLGEMPKKSIVSEKAMQSFRDAAKKYHLNRAPNGVSVNGMIKHAGRFWADAGRVANAYQQSNDQKQRDELLRLFMDYADLVIQQGHGAGYGLRTAYAKPMWLMKDEMKKRGNWNALLKRMRETIGVVNELDLAHPHLNADYANTELRAALFTIFLGDEPRQIFKDLKCLQHWLESVARNGEMKPDGSLFHHIQYYTGYNIPATPPLVDTICLLNGTEFAAPTMHLYLRRVAYAYHLLSATVDLPRTFAGRWSANSQPVTWQIADIYKKLAYLNNPESDPFFSRTPGYKPTTIKNPPSPFDREMAEIYLTFADYYKQENETTKAFRAMGLSAHRDDGNLTINYAVAMVQRRADWMVFIRGQRAPFITGENYKGSTNDPNRYMNYGYMEIVSNGSPVNMEASSWVSNHSATTGWDFNHFPGTTCRKLPASSLRSHFTIDERMTSETFAVGTSLDGNGVFAMKLKEDFPGEDFPDRIGPVKYWLGDTQYNKLIQSAQFDKSFRAKKSYFAFDNRIVCLGSNIISKDTENPVVTTLFQHTLTDTEKNNLSFPVSKTLTPNTKTVSLFDKNGTGYYLPHGNDSIDFQRQFNKNPYPKKWDPDHPDAHNEVYPNEGNTEVAFINHGKAPQNKGYEYCVVVRASKKEMAAFSKSMSQADTAYYKVLQKNAKAHIVIDRPSQTTAYALFSSGEVNQGALISCDQPSVIMIKTTPTGELRLSITDPRISGDHSELDSTEITLVLKGEWKTKAQNIKRLSHTSGTTTITVQLKNLMRSEFELEK